MTRIRLRLEGPQALAEISGLLTAGMTGIPVDIEWDSSWEGLKKTLVCTGGAGTGVVLDVGEQALVAPQALRWSPNGKNELFLGVEGRDATGELVLPSTMAYCGQILPGANPEKASALEPDNPIWAQILAKLEDLPVTDTGQGGVGITSIDITEV